MAKVMIISLCLHGLALLIVTWFDITDLIEELKSDMRQLRIGRGREKSQLLIPLFQPFSPVCMFNIITMHIFLEQETVNYLIINFFR